MPTLTGQDSYSTKPTAIKQRTRMLTDDKYHDKQVAGNATRRNKRRTKAILSYAGGINGSPRYKMLKPRIIFHLSRNRTIGDIVVRENAPASLVMAIVKELEEGK